MNLLKSFLFAASLFIATSACAHSSQQGDIHIGHFWAVATQSGDTEASFYLPLLNSGPTEDRLLSASMPASSKVEMRKSTFENGVWTVVPLSAIILEPNVPVSVRPGGIELVATGLKKPLVGGQMVPIILTFEKNGVAHAKIMVEPGPLSSSTPER